MKIHGLKNKLVTLNDVSFSVKSGEFHGFIGPNGAGKTTTIKIILGLWKPTIGKIYINDQLTENRKVYEKLGYIPENTIFPQGQKVIDFLTIMYTLKGFSLKNAKKKSIESLEEYGITKYKNTILNRLSSGEKKIILMIQCLINNPEILIIDEPTANLDPILRQKLIKKLQWLNENGTTIFMSTHVLAELEGLVDSLTIIDKGEIKFTGKIEKGSTEYQLSFFNNTDMEECKKIINSKIKQFNFDDLTINLNVVDNELEQTLRKIANKKIAIKSIENIKVTLNQLFFKYVGRNNV